MKILFIGGFNTNVEENKRNLYYNFNTYVKLTTHTIDYFTYHTDEDLNTVFEKLTKILQNKDDKYDTILAHSMGGCLITKYISIHPDFNTKVVLLMPLLCKSFNLWLISKIPFIQHLYLPKFLMIPNSDLLDDGNILNDDCRLIPVRQIYQAITENYILDESVLIDLFNTKKNIHMIYVKDERISIIPDNVLNQIDNKSFIDGKHVAFGDIYYSEQFFDTLTNLIT
jgi:hypothetical protein